VRCSPALNEFGSAWVMPAHSLISVQRHGPAARQFVEPAPRHCDEDEFVYGLDDKVAFIEDGGETIAPAVLAAMAEFNNMPCTEDRP
jgi:hypothetical protein